MKVFIILFDLKKFDYTLIRKNILDKYLVIN